MSTRLVSDTPCFNDGLSSRSSTLYTTEKRKAEAERIRQKYPDRIPVCILLITLKSKQ